MLIVKAANPMFIRSRKQTTKRTEIKGRILIRTLWSLLAWMDVARTANSLAESHLGVILPRPGRTSHGTASSKMRGPRKFTETRTL